ncbi:SAM-dependent methyltransferase [Aeromonas hydrophila]|uniref:methyltransferase domain-containing protein n=1 Tax=Aeromonas hydrophila TaxID=644 RepID=UPI00216958DC|nr:class I SAM-dependent methyltransferase [Aeromonas hydrophila]MCS3769173.1 SAM-dependent methyltransferase [Aeromonas hydrophila]MCS3793421.1 SAM-dependent methyltransferase [Aeromonas hydrophila]
MKKISEFDKHAYNIIRESVSSFLKEQAEKLDSPNVMLLDIAPQDHLGAAEHFIKAKIETADLNKDANATYTIDITNNNSEIIPNESFDIVVCTEVLEHTLNPFSAISEIYRILKKDGILLLTTPFNFRIHGPLPDCWRFTEHGINALLKEFTSISITSVEDDMRFLMPYHYTTIAIK